MQNTLYNIVEAAKGAKMMSKRTVARNFLKKGETHEHSHSVHHQNARNKS